MKRLAIVVFCALFSFAAFGQAPSKSELLKHKGDSWEGSLMDEKFGITLVDDGKIQINIYNTSVVYKGQLGPAGGKVGNPIVINLRDFEDGSVARFKWISIDEVKVEWWPSAEAQAGQKQHKPAHEKGTLKRIK